MCKIIIFRDRNKQSKMLLSNISIETKYFHVTPENQTYKPSSEVEKTFVGDYTHEK